MNTDWNSYVAWDAAVMAGKPTIKGTRLTVEFLLSLAAAGWTEQQIIDSYPGLTSAALHAAYGFAAQYLRDESLFPLETTA